MLKWFQIIIIYEFNGNWIECEWTKIAKPTKYNKNNRIGERRRFFFSSSGFCDRNKWSHGNFFLIEVTLYGIAVSRLDSVFICAAAAAATVAAHSKTQKVSSKLWYGTIIEP